MNGTSRHRLYWLAQFAVAFLAGEVLSGIPAVGEEGPREIRGIVVGPEGKPVAAASVWLAQENPYTLKASEQIPVVASGTTDAQGRFRFTLPATSASDHYGWGYRVFAHRPGRSLGALWLLSGLENEECTIDLAAESVLRLTLVGADSRPAADAKVSVAALTTNRQSTELPDAVQELLTAKADAQGKVAIRGVALDQLSRITIHSERLGRQSFYFGDRSRRTERIILRPVGTLRGRLLCRDSARAAGVELRAATSDANRHPDGPYWNSWAELRTDKEGRFQAPAIGAGKLLLLFFEANDLPYRAVPPDGLVIDAGVATDIEVPLRPAVLCRGVVREQASQKPLGGIELHSRMETARFESRTDAAGKYQFYTLPGDIRVRIMTGPDPYMTVNKFVPARVPADQREFDVPPIEVVRGVALEGKVLDAEGKPAREARISARWPDDGAFGGFASTHSDSQGRFELRRVHPTSARSLDVYWKGVQAADGLTVAADDKKPLEIRLRKLDFMSLSGRIVDEEGKPVADAEFEIHSMAPFRGGWGSSWVAYRGKANKEDSFETPQQFLRTNRHQARVVVRRVTVGETEWITSADLGPTRLPDLVYRRSKVPKEDFGVVRMLPLVGQVTDRQGKTLSGAKTLAWYDAESVRGKTDDAGRFRVGAMPEHGGFVFIEAEGYRFFGQYVRPGKDSKEPVRFTLTSDREQPASAWPTLREWQLTPDEQKQTHKMAGECAAKAFKLASDDHGKYQVLQSLTPVDPACALSLLEEARFSERWYKDQVGRMAAVALMASEPEDAKALLNAIDDVGLRSHGYREAAAALPDTKRAAKLALLSEALVLARAVKAPDHRVLNLGSVAEDLFALGEAERATEILRDGEQIARGLGTAEYPAFARGWFARHLARIDAPAAIKLIEALPAGSQHDRHHGNLAHVLAEKHPADAGRMLNAIGEPRDKDRFSSRVCFHMAPVDLAGAKQIAARVTNPCHRAHSIGMIAHAIAKTNKTEAEKLLREAYALLTDVVENGQSLGNSLVHPQTTAVSLLPAAEAVDPRLVPEFAWRALALRRNVAYGNVSFALGRHGMEQQMRLSDPVLAACFARYNREVARLLLQPSADESAVSGDYPWFYFASLALLDPDEAIRLVSAMPEDTADQKRSKQQAWRDVLFMLTRNPQQRWDLIQQRQLFVWSIGQEDF